jgi:hypothetical protein
MSPLLRTMLRAERALGQPLMRATNSPEAAGVLLAVARGAGLVRDGAQAARSTAVHMMALPSHRDVRRLAARLAHVERMLDELQARG